MAGGGGGRPPLGRIEQGLDEPSNGWFEAGRLRVYQQPMRVKALRIGPLCGADGHGWPVCVHQGVLEAGMDGAACDTNQAARTIYPHTRAQRRDVTG